MAKKNFELNNLNKTKDKFFSIIAHDLKNPISAMKNLSKLMVKEYNKMDENDKYDFIREMKDTSSNLSQLLDNLLLWSRSQRDVIEYHPENADICFIIKNNIDLMSLMAKRKSITLYSEGKCPCNIVLDQNTISTVIRNLISNAIKFTSKGGNILVCHEETDKEVIVSIKDDGIGIIKSVKDSLFKIDVSVTTLGTNEERGTGLGLVICKEFINKHRGKIWVESKVGKGSTFFFSIPKK